MRIAFIVASHRNCWLRHSQFSGYLPNYRSFLCTTTAFNPESSLFHHFGNPDLYLNQNQWAGFKFLSLGGQVFQSLVLDFKCSLYLNRILSNSPYYLFSCYPAKIHHFNLGNALVGLIRRYQSLVFSCYLDFWSAKDNLIVLIPWVFIPLKIHPNGNLSLGLA